MRIRNTIYLDHQATTPVDSRVLAEMTPFFSEHFGNPHSSDHVLGWESARAVDEAAARVARLIGADADEIVFTSGATESNNMALLGLGRRGIESNRRRILVSAVEHKCVLAVSRILEEQYGFIVETIPVDHEGFVLMSELNDMMDDDVLAVSIMAVNNEIGTIQDVQCISEAARRHGAIFHCDAAQAPLGMSIDSIAKHADMISLSGHKMYAPKGVGIIFIARELSTRLEPLIYGGGQQDGLRSGTVPVPLCVGMGAASELFNSEEIAETRREICRRRDTFVKGLKELNRAIIVNGPEDGTRHPGNANICFVGFSAHDILGTLHPRLAASTGSACTSGIPEPSHVLRAIGLNSNDAEASIRFSFGIDTTDEDVEDALNLIEGSLKMLASTDSMYSA